MSADEHRRLLESFIEATTTGNLALLDSCVAEDYHQHQPGVPQGLSGLKQFFALGQMAWQEQRGWYENFVSQGDTFVVRMCFEGLHTGSFFGIPPTNKRITLVSADWFRVENGKLAAHWAIVNQADYLKQMGVLTAEWPMDIIQQLSSASPLTARNAAS